MAGIAVRSRGGIVADESGAGGHLPGSVEIATWAGGHSGAVVDSMDPKYGAVGDGSTDDTAAILLAQADMRKFRATLRFTAPHVMTQSLLVMSGDQYESAGYLRTGLIFRNVNNGIMPRDPTDFTDFVKLSNLSLDSLSTAPLIGILLASCRHWTITDVETIAGSASQHAVCLYGQRWADGTSTSGGASAGTPPKARLATGTIGVGDTSITVDAGYLTGDTSQYQLGSARLTANPQSGTTLSSGLSTGAPITSLPVTASLLQGAIASGSKILVSSGTHSQQWTLTATLNVADSTASVVSQTPNFAYPSGSLVGTGFVPVSYGDALRNGSQPRYAKLCTAIGTLAGTMTAWSTSFALATPLPIGTGSGQVPASGAVLVDNEVIWYDNYTAATGTFSGIHRQQRANHSSAVSISVAEIVTYTGVTATTFTGLARGLNGTSAYAHNSNAPIYQNPGDSTDNNFFAGELLTGADSFVRLGGTFGSTWANNGVSNRNRFYGTEVGGVTAAAIAAFHLEAGSINCIIGSQHSGTNGDGVYCQWFNNLVQGYVAGGMGVAGAGVHFSGDSSCHNNVVGLMQFDSGGTGQNIYDESGFNTIVNGYTLKVARPQQPALLIPESIAVTTGGQYYYHDINSTDFALTGGVFSGSAANYTLGTYDRVAIATATCTRTLPDATTCPGRQYTIKNGAAATTVTIATTSAQTIDGAAPGTLTAWQVLRVVSNGTNWVTV